VVAPLPPRLTTPTSSCGATKADIAPNKRDAITPSNSKEAFPKFFPGGIVCVCVLVMVVCVCLFVIKVCEIVPAILGDLVV